MTKELSPVQEIELQIFKIENDPSNVVGGLKAWNSGRQTVLTKTAQKKLDALNSKLDKLLDDTED